MFFCCADTSSDGDEQNTDKASLILFSHATVAPALLSRLSALTSSPSRSLVDSLLDIFPDALDDGTMPDLEMEGPA